MLDGVNDKQYIIIMGLKRFIIDNEFIINLIKSLLESHFVIYGFTIFDVMFNQAKKHTHDSKVNN